MQRKREIRLGYRVYCRQASDVEEYINRAGEALGRVALGCVALDPDRVIKQELLPDQFYPIKPELIPEAKGRGLLITEYQDKQCLILREMSFSILLEEIDNAEEWVEAITAQAGNIFATIAIVAEYVTEVQAI